MSDEETNAPDGGEAEEAPSEPVAESPSVEDATPEGAAAETVGAAEGLGKSKEAETSKNETAEPAAAEEPPAVDEAALERDLLEIVVQVNGKLRGRVSVAVDADNDAVAKLALSDENVQRFVADKTIRKTIVVPGRLVNIVV